jgi:hypothetical protein
MCSHMKQNSLNRFDTKLGMTRNATFAIGLLSVCLLAGCGRAGNHLNPFYEPPVPEALLGQKNDHALSGEQDKSADARAALDAMATYQRAHLPQPVNPVLQPAVVRLMWIPDHLNQHGDLVPAHYYYLKVKGDQWAVQDAFEMESQLGSTTESSNIPYIMK